MKIKSMTFVITMLFVFCPTLTIRAHAQDQNASAANKTYAVLPFDTSDIGGGYPNDWMSSTRPQLASSICDELTTSMVKAGYKMVERSRLNDILKEQHLGETGAVDPATAARVGKLLGAQYIVMGSLTQWGMQERNYGGANIPGLGNRLGVKQTIAEAAIDFRVVDTETGVIAAADTAKGSEINTSVRLTVDWYRGINVGNNEWWGSQIGKATRKAVKNVVGEIVGKKNGELVILDMPDPDDAIVEIDETTKLKKGDTLEVFAITSVTRNDRGKVIFTKTTILGHARVEEVQESGAQLKIIDRVPGAPEIKPGCLVKRK